MTFQEALEFKKSLPQDYIMEGGIKLLILVTPLKSEDFTKYCSDFSMGSFDDKTAIKYSTNNQFQLKALYVDIEEMYYIKA